MIETKEIITDYQILSERADEVDTKKGMKEAREIIAELKTIIRKKNLTSLGATAIGYKKRIFCVNFNDSEIKTFINPIIVKADAAMVLSDEKSLVDEGKRYLVPRNNKIAIMYTSPLGKIESREINGVAAAVFQYEIHLLDGILLSDIGLEIDELFDNATQEEREELINAYLDSLDIRNKLIQKDIQSNEETKQTADAIEFMSLAKEGKIQIERDIIPKAETTENTDGRV